MRIWPKWLTPRRFSIAELLAFVTGYSFLLATMRARGAEAPAIGLCAFYIVCVAAAQLTLWRGRRPLTASVALTVGLSMAPLLLVWALFITLGLINGASQGFGIAEFLIDLVFCTAGGALLGLGAGCIVALVLYAGRVVGNLGNIRRDADGGTRAAVAALPGEPHCRIAAIRGLFHGRRAALTGLVAGLVVLSAVILWTPVRARALHRLMDYAHRKEMANSPGPPVYQLVTRGWISSDSTPYWQFYYWSRDELVRLGYLVHRQYVFKNIQAPSAAATAVWRHVLQRFPNNMHTVSVWSYSPEGKPFRLYVWDTPDQIAAWDEFVATQDVPDSRSR
jgi:hypothetical protein